MKRIALLAVSLTTLFVATGCKVVVTGQSTYEVCDFSSDCYDGVDSCIPVANGSFSDSHCSRSCIDDLDCPGSGICVDFGGGGTCFQSCITSAICEAGWSCTAVAGVGSMCLPGSGTPSGIPPYNTCTSPGSTGGCSAESDGCAEVWLHGVAGAFCTNNCSSSAQCPIDSRGVQGACVRLGDNPRICYETCVDDDDCLVGYSCLSADGSEPVCLPTG